MTFRRAARDLEGLPTLAGLAACGRKRYPSGMVTPRDSLGLRAAGEHSARLGVAHDRIGFRSPLVDRGSRGDEEEPGITGAPVVQRRQGRTHGCGTVTHRGIHPPSIAGDPQQIATAMLAASGCFRCSDGRRACLDDRAGRSSAYEEHGLR
jgi:hypothetical protein